MKAVKREVNAGLYRVRAQHATGSRYICDPPVENTDNDTIILVNDFNEPTK